MMNQIIAVRVVGGAVYIPIRPVCERLGVDWSSQYRRTKRDEILNSELRSVAVTTTEPNRTRNINMVLFAH